jgi:hypothetical protein
MKSLAFRTLTAVLTVLALWLALAGAASTATPRGKSNHLVILSTTDVKGKTSPCG